VQSRAGASLATTDRMSGGRLIAGVGVGWSEAEFAALVPFHERGARTNEYLRLWQACWAPGKVSGSVAAGSSAMLHFRDRMTLVPANVASSIGHQL
jgi:alkanesulfonate monooxygenase SsuD/methylene tetrahydromethanopterin reductase-like flavin-dependent oxidoreductase (luciferase family)